jgi:Ca-activated chloride channel family protein
VTIAKDVKIQVEFNPTLVRSYRLIGYENRTMAAQDFNDDRKDAGEIGAGHTVTAFYEVVPQGLELGGAGVDPLKYQQRPVTPEASATGEMLTLKLRYKQPNSDTSQLLTFPVRDSSTRIEEASQDFRFAASVAAFGMVLRNSQHKGSASLDMVRSMAEQSIGPDTGGYRSEFLQLIIMAQSLMRPQGEYR